MFAYNVCPGTPHETKLSLNELYLKFHNVVGTFYLLNLDLDGRCIKRVFILLSYEAARNVKFRASN